MRTLCILALAALTAGAASPATAGVRTERVVIDDIEFKRPKITVRKGTVVTWKSREANVTHTVSSRGEKRFPSSGSMRKGDAHRVRFDRRGTYRYVCVVHPASMRGRVRVR